MLLGHPYLVALRVPISPAGLVQDQGAVQWSLRSSEEVHTRTLFQSQPQPGPHSSLTRGDPIAPRVMLAGCWVSPPEHPSWRLGLHRELQPQATILLILPQRAARRRLAQGPRPRVMRARPRSQPPLPLASTSRCGSGAKAPSPACTNDWARAL